MAIGAAFERSVLRKKEGCRDIRSAALIPPRAIGIRCALIPRTLLIRSAFPRQ